MKKSKMIDEIVLIYTIADDLLKAIAHQENCRRTMSDAQVITSALTASLFFCGNHLLACNYLKEHGLIPNMLSKSRFSCLFPIKNRDTFLKSTQIRDLCSIIIPNMTRDTPLKSDVPPYRVATLG